MCVSYCTEVAHVSCDWTHDLFSRSACAVVEPDQPMSHLKPNTGVSDGVMTLTKQTYDILHYRKKPLDKPHFDILLDQRLISHVC